VEESRRKGSGLERKMAAALGYIKGDKFLTNYAIIGLSIRILLYEVSLFWNKAFVPRIVFTKCMITETKNYDLVL
jgi:hypothetical protein